MRSLHLTSLWPHLFTSFAQKWPKYWTLTPQFFANKPVDLLFHEGVRAEMFNRFKLGRTLDEASGYGCDLLLSELALSVCLQEGIDARFNHLDTTSFSLTGAYVPDSDEHA